MMPIPFAIGTYRVSAYDAVHLATMAVAISLVALLNRSQGIPIRATLSISAVAAIAARFGARLLDMLEYSRSFHFWDLLGRGTSSIYGGLILSLVVVALSAAVLGVPVRRFLDGAAPALALAEGMTRVGCFLAGCCYGVVSNIPIRVTFPPGSFAYTDQIARGILPLGAARSLPVHPVQLYSVALAFLITWFLVVLFRRRHREGQVFYLFLVSYGCLRLAVAPFRVEVLRSMKAFSIAFIILGTLGYRTAGGAVREPITLGRRQGAEFAGRRRG